MSRFNFDLTQQPKEEVVKSVLPTFTEEEKTELVDFAPYKQREKMQEILEKGELVSLDEIQKITKTHQPGKYFVYLDPSDPSSLREISSIMELLHDINTTMRLDLNLSQEGKFIYCEIRITEISKNKKRLVLAISINTEKPMSHQQAWGYSPKPVKTKTTETEGGDNYNEGF